MENLKNIAPIEDFNWDAYDLLCASLLPRAW